MIVTTTPSVEGREIIEYKGIMAFLLIEKPFH